MELKIAIVENNTLAVLGLKQLLQAVIPVMDVDTYGSFADLEQHSPDAYVHYFVSVDILQSHRSFFAERRRKTIVLTPSPAKTPSSRVSTASLSISPSRSSHAPCSTFRSTPIVVVATCPLCRSRSSPSAR